MNDLEILKSQMDICELHKDRIVLALKYVGPLAPLKADKLKSLTDEQLGFLELLTARYAKLEDAIGKKIFPSMLKALQEYDSSQSFLDQLHKLEKLGVIESFEFWSRFRKVRNDISHEYPEHQEEIAIAINECVEISQVMLNFWEHLKIYIQSHIFEQYQ